jgi:hypothetical protein
MATSSSPPSALLNAVEEGREVLQEAELFVFLEIWMTCSQHLQAGDVRSEGSNLAVSEPVGGAANPLEPVVGNRVFETYPVLAMISLGWTLPDSSPHPRRTGRMPKIQSRPQKDLLTARLAIRLQAGI